MSGVNPSNLKEKWRSEVHKRGIHTQTDRQTDRKTDRQTDRQTDRHTDRQTHTHMTIA